MMKIAGFVINIEKGKHYVQWVSFMKKDIYAAFLSVHNKLLDNQDILKAMLNQLLELQTKVMFTRSDIVELNEKISELIKQNHSLTRVADQGCIDSAIFIERSNLNNQKIEELRRELQQLQEPDEVSRIVDSTKLLLELLEEAQPMLEFEPSVFKSMVLKIVVYPERFSFHLYQRAGARRREVLEMKKNATSHSDIAWPVGRLKLFPKKVPCFKTCLTTT